MIEAGANEVPEDQMIEAIYKAHEVNQEIIRFFDQIIAECGKEKHSLSVISAILFSLVCLSSENTATSISSGGSDDRGYL